MDNLYVHLQSDSSPEFFPNNTICDFRNQLAGSLDLDPAYYEVALVQCSYVYNAPCIKAGKEVAQLRVVGPIIDYCDTVRNTEIITIEDHDRDHDFKVIDQNDFMLTADSLIKFKLKSSAEVDKIKDLVVTQNKTCDIYRITENIIECRLARTVSNFDELVSYVNDKLTKYDSRISYDQTGKKIIYDLNSNVHSVDFLGTYYSIFNGREGYESFTPHDWFNANTKNIISNTKLFNIRVTKKIEHLGQNNHRHILPASIPPTETIELSIPASKYYEDDTKGNLKVHEYVYKITLDEDVYDVDGLVSQLKQKIPSPFLKYENNIVSMSYTDSVYDFVSLIPSEQVKAILGISEITTTHSVKNTHLVEKGVFRPFFGYGQQKMYIYADIIENQFIGSQLAPLLRITDYKGQNATTTTQEFAHHHYVPLRNMNLDQIHVYIRSENSDYLPIELGTFSATLHFRRKRF